MAGTVQTNLQWTGRTVWRYHNARTACFRPFQSARSQRSAACRAKGASDELQLVKREETNDGAILFVFGDEAAIQAHKSQEEKEEAPSAPAEQEAPVQEPEEAYEAARAEQAVESPAEVAAEEEQQQHAQQEEAPANGAMVPDFEEFEMDPDEALSDEDAPDLQDEIAKTLTSLRVTDLKTMCKERGMSGYSKYRKSQLVRLLKEAMLVESE